MESVFTHYPQLTSLKIRKQNKEYDAKYDEYDHQNDKDAIACFLNSLGEDYRRRLRVKSSRIKKLKFTDIFMMFIEIERPQNAKLYDSMEKKVLNMQPSDYPGGDIVKMSDFAREHIVAIFRGNAWDSKNNIALTRILIEAGGKENEEFLNPMHLLLTKVRKAVAQVTHLNSAEKDEKLSSQGLGWEDILNEAEELYRTMTVDGNVRWPPQCSVDDSKAPPQGYGAHLTQFRPNGK